MHTRRFVERKDCPTCTSQNVRGIYSCNYLNSPLKEYLESFYNPQGKIEFEYLEQAAYILNGCLDCGTIFQQSVPDEFLANKLYEEWIDPEKTFERHLERDDLNHFRRYAEEVILLIGYFGVPAFQIKMLDFGMGWGKWIAMAKAFGCDCKGLEISSSRIDFAGSQGIEVLTLKDIPPHSFDFINCEQIFEHIPQPLETLRCLQKVLKAGGMIKINVPNGSKIKPNLIKEQWASFAVSAESLNPVSPLEHINCYTRSSLIRMAAMAEMQPVDMPISLQWNSIVNVKGLKGIIKSLLRPFYVRYFSNKTNLYFKNRTPD
jgi:2-polyprenyl-3-methyl-5-hydroxy-6-metoxy-1,4-benzoquinol methylase